MMYKSILFLKNPKREKKTEIQKMLAELTNVSLPSAYANRKRKQGYKNKNTKKENILVEESITTQSLTLVEILKLVVIQFSHFSLH